MTGRLSSEEIEQLLHANTLGRLGCSDGDEVYVVPVSYIYDGKYIIAHSLAGKKIHLMRKNPKVCFEVDEVRNFTNWKSVIAHGRYQEITDERERYQAMKMFVDRMLRLKISETAQLPEMSAERVHPRTAGTIRPVIYRILLTEKSGRFESNEP